MVSRISWFDRLPDVAHDASGDRAPAQGQGRGCFDMRTYFRWMLPLCVGVAGLPAARAEGDSFLEPTPYMRAVAAFERGDLPTAEALVTPVTVGPAATADDCALLGQIRQKQNRGVEAVALFERAVAVQPQRATLRTWLGAALLDQALAADGAQRVALLRRARATLERAFELDAGHVDAVLGLLRYHLLSPLDGDPASVTRYADTAAKLDPLSAPYDIAALAEELGRFELAEKYYGIGAAAEPANPWLRWCHGRMLAKLGRVAEARAEFERILKEIPGFPAAQKSLAELPAQ